MFLAAFFVFASFRCGADFLNLRIAAAGDFLITRLDDHVALFAQRFQIIAHGRLHALGIKVVRNFIFDFVERLLTGFVALKDLQDKVALLGVHDIGQFVFLHLKNHVFELLGKLAAFVNAEEAALLGRAAVGKALGNFAEIFAVFHAL